MSPVSASRATVEHTWPHRLGTIGRDGGLWEVWQVHKYPGLPSKRHDKTPRAPSEKPSVTPVPSRAPRAGSRDGAVCASGPRRPWGPPVRSWTPCPPSPGEWLSGCGTPSPHQSHVASRARTGNGEGDDQERVAWRVAFGLSIKAGAGHGVLWESSASPGRGRAAPRPLLLPRPLRPQRLCSASLCHAGAVLKCWCQGGGRGRPSSTGVGHTAPKGS